MPLCEDPKLAPWRYPAIWEIRASDFRAQGSGRGFCFLSGFCQDLFDFTSRYIVDPSVVRPKHKAQTPKP